MSNWKNVNNWHWVHKNCIAWAKEYFGKDLESLQTKDNNENSAEITELVDCTGDVDLSQRKGKIITIFDVKLKYSWKGKLSDGTEVNGTIEVPEVAHDTDEDEYVFDVAVDDDSNAKDVVKKLVKKELTPQLRKKFANFASDLIKNHGSDVYIEPSKLGQPAPPRPAVPTTVQHSAATQINNGTNAAAENGSQKKAQEVNTTNIKMDVEFQTSAKELFVTLTDAGRVQTWSRGPYHLQSDNTFALFGGNVTGQVKEEVDSEKIVQSWRLRSWPEGHFSTVTFKFKQGSDFVKLEMEQKGVPVGKEEETERNWKAYYWQPIKQTFGFGATL